MKIFIDTSAFYALYSVSDSLHKKSMQIGKGISDDARLFTSSDIVGETMTLLSMRLGKLDALYFHEKILDGIETVLVDLEIFNDAIAMFKNVKSKNVSFVDCTSFAICKRDKMDYAFTFDKHFAKQRIKILG